MFRSIQFPLSRYRPALYPRDGSAKGKSSKLSNRSRIRDGDRAPCEVFSLRRAYIFFHPRVSARRVFSYSENKISLTPEPKIKTERLERARSVHRTWSQLSFSLRNEFRLIFAGSAISPGVIPYAGDDKTPARVAHESFGERTIKITLASVTCDRFIPYRPRALLVHTHTCSRVSHRMHTHTCARHTSGHYTEHNWHIH